MPRYIDAYSLSDKVCESKKNNPHEHSIARRAHNHEHEHFLNLIANESTVDVEQIEAEAIKRYVEKLKEHYPYSPSVCNTIDRVAFEILTTCKNRKE